MTPQMTLKHDPVHDPDQSVRDPVNDPENTPAGLRRFAIEIGRHTDTQLGRADELLDKPRRHADVRFTFWTVAPIHLS